MPSDVKARFLQSLRDRFGDHHKLPNSQSLFELSDGRTRVYVRYSKRHEKNRTTFFGLRQQDLAQLEGRPAAICFLWDGQVDPLMLPAHEYEEVFRLVPPAADGQFKAQVHLQGDDGAELYIAKAGRFNVEGRFGWGTLQELTDRSMLSTAPSLSHSQVQTLLGSIGARKGFDIWVPSSDRSRLDWSVASKFDCRDTCSEGYPSIASVIEEIDVIWMHRGSSRPSAFFEVEHSTPIYSALLRFNDVHLTSAQGDARFSVVANDARHALFVRQLARPTFVASGLRDRCTFLEYIDVLGWHRRLSAGIERA